MTYVIADGDAMRDFARDVVAPRVRRGDLIILTGDLGAGKTTFTQGLGAALGVRGPIASPTFIIARTHPSLVDGPALVHVDAYRLGSLAELDDLDLDATLEDAVTVVEWGEDKAEALADDRLHVTISRARGGAIDPDAPDGGDRIVALAGHGERWAGVEFGDAA
jgi:tRNA threonylcarbamoyladenosine biosynthesis protein TsaE